MKDLRNLSLSWLAGIALGLTIFGVVAGAGCGPKSRATIHDTATCAEDQAKKDLQPVVAFVLTSGVSNYVDILTAFARAYGGDLIDCIVKAVKADLLQKNGGASDAIQRADAWLGRGRSAVINSRDFPHGLAAAIVPTPDGCDSASIMQATGCVGDWFPAYDGCHWRCALPAVSP